MLVNATAAPLRRCFQCHEPGPDHCERCRTAPERRRLAKAYREQVRDATLSRLDDMPRPSLDEGSAKARDRIIGILECCMHQVEFELVAAHLVTPEIEAGLDGADRRLVRQYLIDRDWSLRDTLEDTGPREEAPARMPLDMWLYRWHRDHA